MSFPLLNMPSSSGYSESQNTQEMTPSRRRKLGVCFLYNPNVEGTSHHDKNSQKSMNASKSFDLPVGNQVTESETHSIIVASNYKATSERPSSTVPRSKRGNPPPFPGRLSLTVLRRFSHYTLSFDDRANSTGHLSTRSRKEKSRSVSLPSKTSVPINSNTKERRLYLLCSHEPDNQLKTVVASEKKLSSASSSSGRYLGFGRTLFSLLFSNQNNNADRPVKLPGGQRMRTNFFERRRNAICSELDNDVALITAKMKYKKINKERNRNPLRFCRRWLCF